MDSDKPDNDVADDRRIPLSEAEGVSDLLKEIRLTRVAIDAQTLTLALCLGAIAAAILMGKGKGATL